MDYVPQTMSEAELEQRLNDLLERAKALEVAVLETDRDITDTLQKVETSVDASVAVIDTELEALEQVEKETEFALDTLILREAEILADE